MQNTKGIRTVALYEAAHGLLVLFAGFGLLSLIHHDVQQVAEEIVGHFHLDPASRYPRIFLQVAENLSDKQLWMMAAFALAYASIRLVEAYGLWNERRWAEWLAVVSGAMYVPIEIYELLSGVTLIKVSILIINICIVVYMAYILMKSHGNAADQKAEDLAKQC